MKQLSIALCLLLTLGLQGCFLSKKHRAKKAAQKKELAERKSPEKQAEKALLEKYAQALEVDQSALNPKLYSFVDDWIGVPYKYGGTTKTGADCSGFTNTLYLNVYQKQIARSTSEIEKTCKTVSEKQVAEGDLVFFDIAGKKSSHVGVYLHNGRFVHASTSKGVIISEVSNPYYTKYFARYCTLR